MAAAEVSALKPGRAAYRRCGKLFFREEVLDLAAVAKGATLPQAQACCGIATLLLALLRCEASLCCAELFFEASVLFATTQRS